jgi:hypothetical protein
LQPAPLSHADGRIDGRQVNPVALSVVMFHIAAHAAGFLMQLLARLPESIADSKRQIGMAFVLGRSTLDVDFLALGQREANVHLIEAAFAVMLAGRLYHHTTGRYAPETLVKLRYMRSNHFLDLRRPLHALKYDFRRSFHRPYSGNPRKTPEGRLKLRIVIQRPTTS